MAIVMRRGNAADFKPEKMKAGEWAVCLDTQELYMSFATGTATKIATFADVTNIVAPPYSNQATYEVGDYCSYGDKVYICTTAVTEPSNFNVNAWNVTNVVEMISRIIGTYFTPGDNIQIQNGVISATDTTYTAGSNIVISEDNEISALTITTNAHDVVVDNPVADSSVYPNGYKYVVPLTGITADVKCDVSLVDLTSYYGAYAVESDTDQFVLYFDHEPAEDLALTIYYNTGGYESAEEREY